MHEILLTAGGLYIVILLRAGATYALGRAAGAGVKKTKLGRRIPHDKLTRVEAAITRWGAPVVAASFLTIGFQTAANFVAGSLRLRLTRYIPALAVGGLAWAFIYATIGVGVIEAVSRVLTEHPQFRIPALVVALCVVTTIAVLIIRAHRRRRDT